MGRVLSDLAWAYILYYCSIALLLYCSIALLLYCSIALFFLFRLSYPLNPLTFLGAKRLNG